MPTLLARVVVLAGTVLLGVAPASRAQAVSLLEFYRSPLGQRLLEPQPGLIQESVQLGQRWGARIGAEIGQQLAAEGVHIQP